MSFRITADFSEVLRGFQNMQNALPQSLEATLVRVAEESIQVAKDTVPVDTGTLQRSIRVLERGPNYVIIGSDVEYALYVELGTYKMQAQPYLGPAMDSAHTRLMQIFSDEFNRRLR